jgi:hypothetical protein
MVCPMHFNPADYFMEITNAAVSQEPLFEAWKEEAAAASTAAASAAQITVHVVDGDQAAAATATVPNAGGSHDSGAVAGSVSCGVGGGASGQGQDAAAAHDGVDGVESARRRLLHSYMKRLQLRSSRDTKSWRQVNATLAGVSADQQLDTDSGGDVAPMQR